MGDGEVMKRAGATQCTQCGIRKSIRAMVAEVSLAGLSDGSFGAVHVAKRLACAGSLAPTTMTRGRVTSHHRRRFDRIGGIRPARGGPALRSARRRTAYARART